MSKQPKEIRDIEKQLKVTTIAVRWRTMNFSIAPQHAALICGVKAPSERNEDVGQSRRSFAGLAAPL
jgi:hypothetical protein